MLNVERRTGNELPPLGSTARRAAGCVTRSAWARRRVVMALCLAHPSTKKRGSDALVGPDAAQAAADAGYVSTAPRTQLVRGAAPINLKTTLVLTNVSLVGQWEDEFRKFAPGLRVQRFYGGRKFTKRAIGDWRDVDVLISTFTTPFYTDNRFGNALIADGIMFHRVIIDECHLARYEAATSTTSGPRTSGPSRARRSRARPET